MHCPHKHEEDRSERGAALLIAIFALLLISVVGIAMIVSTGTDSALTGNYRTSTSAYYAALAGLEEARGRLYWKAPNYINIAAPSFLTPQGTPALAPTTVLYIINPNVAAGEAVVPYDLSNPATFPDTEYQSEFGVPPPTTAVLVNSVSPVAGLPGQSFKWVRINAVTEKALQVHVAGGTGSTYDSSNLLSYDGTGLNLTSSGNQVLEITAYAVLPNGSARMLQYIVAPVSLNLNFPAALTLIGSPTKNVQFTGPGTSTFNVDGNDNFSVGSCNPGPTPVYAIGYAGGSDNSGINAVPAGRYQGQGGSSTVPSELAVPPSFLPASFQTPATLNAWIQTIEQNADASLSPTPSHPAAVLGSDLPSTMNSANPMTIFVNGNLDLTNWHGIGYGLLLVTGTLTYDPDATWNGIVLVIGQGNFVSTKGGTHQFNGAMLLATIFDSSGNLLPAFGPASFSQTGGSSSGYGIYYSSCWVKTVQTPIKYQVLSFRELGQ